MAGPPNFTSKLVYPKLPPLRSSEIEWDHVDPASRLPLPPSPPNANRPQTQKHQDASFRANKSRVLEPEGQGGELMKQSDAPSVRANKSRGLEPEGRGGKLMKQSDAPTRFPGIKAMAYFVGICLHLLHICLYMHRMRNAAECNCTWEHFRDDKNNEARSWTDFGCVILIVAAAFHGYFISTCCETYRLSGRKKKPWYPNEFALTLFCIYSPAHALMWMITTSANWILMVIIMAVLSKQMVVFGQAYDIFVK